ncbi:putative uncharacterized protein [Firmicutes bacterium CAG:884]|nr:putative uncharacterized protein [Firmicutes bacterium CAG:884]
MGKSRLSRTQQLEPVIDNTDRDEKLERLFKEEIKETPKAKKTTLQKVRDVMVSIFTIIVIIACWYAIIVKMILKVDVPMVGGYSALIVLSGSMEPTIKTGEVIVIHAQKDYKIKDILTYREGGILVTHRIVDETETTYTTRGDANNTDDPPIKKTQAIGKTIFHIPYLGKAILFVQSPIGLASVLAVLIGLKVMYSLIRTKQEDLEL